MVDGKYAEKWLLPAVSRILKNVMSSHISTDANQKWPTWHSDSVSDFIQAKIQEDSV
jgi:hypothetical protein